jgi:hypothetical protein
MGPATEGEWAGAPHTAQKTSSTSTGLLQLRHATRLPVGIVLVTSVRREAPVWGFLACTRVPQALQKASSRKSR